MHRPTRTELLALLQRHIGRERGVTAREIAARLSQGGEPVAERLVRELVTGLREEGVAVCGHPADGYFIAATREELEETCAFLRSRAMHSLVLEAKLRGMPLADLVGQLHLPT